jgi:hypothetical protein
VDAFRQVVNAGWLRAFRGSFQPAIRHREGAVLSSELEPVLGESGIGEETVQKRPVLSDGRIRCTNRVVSFESVGWLLY